MVLQLIQKAEIFISSVLEKIDKKSTYPRYCIPKSTATEPSQVRAALSGNHLTGWDDHQRSVCPSQSRKGQKTTS